MSSLDQESNKGDGGGQYPTKLNDSGLPPGGSTQKMPEYQQQEQKDNSEENSSTVVVHVEDPQALCQQANALIQQAKAELGSKNQEQTFSEAMALYQKAFLLSHATLGENHTSLAELHSQIARALTPQRHYTTAMEHYAKAQEIFSASKDNSNDVLQLQKEMAQTLDIMVEAANAAMMEGMEWQTNGRSHGDTDSALWQFEYAHSLLASVLKHTPPKLAKIDGAVSEETTLHTLAFVDVCRVLASVHVSRSDYSQALPYLQQAYELLVPLVGIDDPRTLAMASDKATVQALTLKRQGIGMGSESEREAEILHWFEQDDYNDTTIYEDDQKEEESSDSSAVPYLGVSIDWIKRGFWQELQDAALKPHDTMLQAMEKVIKPKADGGSYVRKLASRHTGAASVMVSYADESTIADIINTLDDYCRTHGFKDTTVYVWMTGLCEKNTAPTNATEDQASANEEETNHNKELEQRIGKIGHLLAILTPWTHPLIWKQPSCLLEISAAQQSPGCKLTLVLPPAQTAAVSDALIGDPSVPLAALYQALDNLSVVSGIGYQVTQRLQGIFRPWIRDVIKAQVQEQCSSDASIDNASPSNLASATDESDENSPQQKKRPSITTARGEEVAMEVFQLQLCNKVGLLFWHYGEYKAALELLEDALGMTERMYGEEHESTATVYQNIANVCSDMGRYAVARETYHKVLSMMEANLPECHPRIAGICTKLGNLYRMTDTLDKAMEFHQKALTIHIKNHGSNNNLASAGSYNDMGHVFFSKGDNDAALMEFRKALGIQNAVLDASNEKHPALAATHSNIGMVLKATGDMKGALQEYRSAAKIQEELYGLDHVQTAMTYDLITDILRQQDKLDAALKMCTKAKTIYENALGENHPTTATSWQTLGGIQNDIDLVEESLESYQKALEIREFVLGPDHPQTAETLESIGTLRFEIGDLDEALIQLRKAFDIVEPIMGIEHPTTKRLADIINAVLEA